MEQINEQQARALAAFIATIRDDWGVRGIVKALSDARTKADAAGLAQAAIRAAATPTNRTPAIIAMPGEHWDNGLKGLSGAEQGAALAARYRAEDRMPTTTEDHEAGRHKGRKQWNCSLCHARPGESLWTRTEPV